MVPPSGGGGNQDQPAPSTGPQASDTPLTGEIRVSRNSVELIDADGRVHRFVGLRPDDRATLQALAGRDVLLDVRVVSANGPVTNVQFLGVLSGN